MASFMFCCRTQDEILDQPPPSNMENEVPMFDVAPPDVEDGDLDDGGGEAYDDPFGDSTPAESRDRLSAIEKLERDRAQREAERLAAAKAAYVMTDDGGDAVLVLLSATPSSAVIAARQEEVRKRFDAFGIALRVVNGSNPACREQRESLWSLSSRCDYPQVFTRIGGTVVFVGGHEEIDRLAECESFPEETLAAHPEIESFSERFEFFLR